MSTMRGHSLALALEGRSLLSLPEGIVIIGEGTIEPPIHVRFTDLIHVTKVYWRPRPPYVRSSKCPRRKRGGKRLL